MNSFEEIWLDCKNQLLNNIPPSVEKPFRMLDLKSINDDGVLTLSCPSNFYHSLVKEYIPQIENTVSEALNEEIKVNIVVEKPSGSKKTTQETIENKKTLNSSSKEKKPAEKKIKSNLNKKYRLDNFISGDNSAFAYEIAQIISKNPGTSYNPVLIYGGVGLGKTHLLQGIGNYIEEHNSDKTVIYTTAESFTNEFISVISKDINARTNFKKKYRKADVLLIDDIHFFEKKESTQEELFHIFNELYDRESLIVFTCDRPITELKNITDRLKTRFTRGTNVDLKPPEYETRVAIARQKMKNLGVKLSPDIVDFICTNVKTNVRDLEGAITTLGAALKITGKDIKIEDAREYLESWIVPEMLHSNKFTLNEIFSVTANYFNVSLVDMKSSSRKSHISVARQVGIYIAVKIGHFSQTEIGTFLNKDHTSISYTYNKLSSQIEIDESLKKAVKEIQIKLEQN